MYFKQINSWAANEIDSPSPEVYVPDALSMLMLALCCHGAEEKKNNK